MTIEEKYLELRKQSVNRKKQRILHGREGIRILSSSAALVRGPLSTGR